VTKELRKEFGRASDHSTHYGASMRSWTVFKPTGNCPGPAVDLASAMTRMEVELDRDR
jgi:hypothetical protein